MRQGSRLWLWWRFSRLRALMISLGIVSGPEPIFCICCGAPAHGWFCGCCYEAKEAAYAECREIQARGTELSHLDVLELRDRRLAEHRATVHPDAEPRPA